ncbi:pimeloyl-ACP methyl ester carboxylesterase [Crossiella equi]|uniref:Pimeloyl-ACP methyl ester carboxylesterase n=1 Tax=Crossiella equi TaxID=130796 RepID=A0ABS5ATH6_9PSEU|nr:alpha/beta fold hydrolase [Crossiella equi]MBP2479544.1 pimeloyl-ACP methyl ester carboxylesterase [Crossiella equi]
MVFTKVAAVALAVAVSTLPAGVYAHGERAPATETTASAPADGWRGITRRSVSIDLGRGWVTKGELSFPASARKKLPLVVLLHGSGHNDMNSTLPGGVGSVFVPVAQAANREGFAVLRFNKRGVTGVGPTLTEDQSQLNPPKPYEQILSDAAAVTRFGAALPEVDPARVHLLGHSEGTQVAGNLAADPRAADIPKPAGVIAMGVVGGDIRSLITYQLVGVRLAQLHEEFDVDGDGSLTRTEITHGLLGQPADLVAYYRDVLLTGDQVKPGTDTNRDGALAIDAEVGRVLRAKTRIDQYPDAEGVDENTRRYLLDINRFANVSVDLPKFDGPTLLLNGENDVQTPARVARVADDAIAKAGRRDHTLITYPGIGHVMNVTSKFTGKWGDPDQAVLRDLARWLGAHR